MHIAGYTVANDYGLHDFRDTDAGSMLRVKGSDTLCPVGPALVTGWDFRGKSIRTYVNGEVVQEGNTDEMEWELFLDGCPPSPDMEVCSGEHAGGVRPEIVAGSNRAATVLETGAIGITLSRRPHTADGAGMPAMAEHSAADGTTPADRDNDPPDGVSLAADYLRHILRLEAIPANASGADKSWVHRAHADAVRHLSSARRR